MEYQRLVHRVIDFHKQTFSEFTPVDSEFADQESQLQMHQFLYSVLGIIEEQPDLLKLPDVPDDIFKGMQKFQPELRKNIKNIAGKLVKFYSFLIEIGKSGKIVNNSMVLSALTKPKQQLLTSLGLTVKNNAGKTILSHSDLPKLFPAWKVLATLKTEHIRFNIFLFSRAIFSATGQYVLSALKPAFDQKIYVEKLIDDLIKNGYEYEQGVSTNSMDMVVRYRKDIPGKSKPLTALILVNSWQKPGQLEYRLDIMEPLNFLKHYDEMDDQLQEEIFNRSRKCNGCGYCIQTDKSKPFKAVKLSYAGQSILKCPYFPKNDWYPLDKEAMDIMIKIRTLNEKILTC